MNTQQKRKLREFEELSKRVKVHNYSKTYSFADGKVITLVALIYKEKVDNIVKETAMMYDHHNGKQIGETTAYTNKKQYVKKLRIGYALLHPEDEPNDKIGREVALKCAILCPICHMESKFTGEFNDETVDVIMDVKAEFLRKKFYGK